MANPTEWYTSLQNQRPSVRAPREGRRGGGYPDQSGFLSRRWQIMNDIAQAKLDMLRDQRDMTKEDRALRFQFRNEDKDRARIGAIRPRGPDYGSAARAYRGMTRAKRAPFDVSNLAQWMKFVGPQAISQGLMQSGRLLMQGGRGGGGGGAPAPEQSPYSAASGNTRGNPGWLGNAPSSGMAPIVEAQRKYGTPIQSGSVLGGREKGGTVPKTGPYDLHKGEIVISADQVDRPLLDALKADKLNKMYSGQMDGKGTGPGPPTVESMLEDEFGEEDEEEEEGLQKGTLGSYESGTDPSYLDREIADWKGLPGRLKGYYTDAAKAAGNPLGIGTDPNPIAREVFWKTLNEPVGDRELGKRIREGAKFAGGAISDAAGEFFAGLTGDPVQDEQAIPEVSEGGPPPSLASGMTPADLPVGPQTPEGFIPENERSFLRARGGDLGSAEDPLSIIGDPNAPLQNTTPEQNPFTGLDPSLSPEDQIFNPNSKAWRKSESDRIMALGNRQKAERIEDYLAREAGNIDPKQHAELSGQAKQLNQSYQTFERRQDTRQKMEMTLMQRAQESLNEYNAEVDKERVKAGAEGNEWDRREGKKFTYDMKKKLIDLQRQFAEDGFDDPDSAIDLMTSINQGILESENIRVSREASRLYIRRDIGDIDSDVELAEELDDIDQLPDSMRYLLSQ